MQLEFTGIDPETRIELLIALQNLTFLIATARATQNRRRQDDARHLFARLANLRPHPSEPATTPRLFFIATEQILIPVPAGQA